MFQTELFLGLCNVYRRFVSGFAKFIAHLIMWLRKEKPLKIELVKTEREHIDVRKTKLMSLPVLSLPKSTGLSTVHFEAPNSRAGSLLLQAQEGKYLKSIGYWLKSSCSASHNYRTTHTECLAVVSSTSTFHQYLEGKQCVLCTDHQALRWIMDSKKSPRRFARWKRRLLQFAFEMVRRSGAHLKALDAMLRPLQTKDEEEPSLIDGNLPNQDVQSIDSSNGAKVMLPSQNSAFMLTEAEMTEAHGGDPFRGNLWLMRGTDLLWLFKGDGSLCWKSVAAGNVHKTVSQKNQAAVLYHAYYSRLAGHPGAWRMYDSM